MAEESVPGLATLHRYGRALAGLHGIDLTPLDEGIVTHQAVVDWLPASIHADFQPPVR